MPLKFKLKVENPVMLIFSVFYAVAGAAEVFVMVFSAFTTTRTLVHVGVLGLLSLITAYGLFRTKKWSVPLVIALFFLGVTFGATTLYDSIILQTFQGALLFHVALIVYLIMTVVAFVYVAAKRKDFG